MTAWVGKWRVGAIGAGRVGSVLAAALRAAGHEITAVAGESDVLAPKGAVAHVESLLTGAPSVRMEVAPGGHLGVLTGRSAERTTWRRLDEFLLETA